MFGFKYLKKEKLEKQLRANQANFKFDMHAWTSSGIPLSIRALPFALGGLAGLAGAQQNVVTKSVSELLRRSVADDNQFGYPLFWVLVALQIFFAIFQIA